MLVHPDARHLVERAIADLAVVSNAHAYAPLQPRGGDPAPRKLRLGLRERHADALRAVMRGSVHDQRPPSASDVEQALARSQAQLAAR